MNGKLYSQSELDYLKEHYPNKRTDVIAKALNRTIYSVYGQAHKMKLTKSTEFLASPDGGGFQKGSTVGKEFRFKKGQTPPNKGKKMSPELYEKCQHTMFKKGNIPGNTKKDGEITIRHGNTSTPYFYIRLSAGKWEELHRYLWEKENGLIPKGFNVVFKDGNQVNCRIENLELISDAELMRRNSLYNYPEDLQKLIRVKGSLQRQINKIIENE